LCTNIGVLCLVCYTARNKMRLIDNCHSSASENKRWDQQNTDKH